jgi:hypothetical protein
MQAKSTVGRSLTSSPKGVVASVYSAFGNIEGFFGDWLGVDWSGVEDTLDYWFPTDV